MSSQPLKSVTLSPTKICSKAICGTCNKYDDFEPAKECLNLGIGCKFNKPVICGHCGHYRTAQAKGSPCGVGYYTKAQSKACRQAVSISDCYKRGI